MAGNDEAPHESKPPPPDVPEADADEQLQEWSGPEVPERPRIDIGVPEADAIEQSQPAPLDEEDEYR